MSGIQINKCAPDFALPDQNGKLHKLSDDRGRWVLLYFYPEDDTPGCTKEACGIRDNFTRFQKQAVTVLGVSVDSVASHLKFVKKYNLPFTLLADEDKQVVKLYNVWGAKKFMGHRYESAARTSFLIDPRGQIAKIYKKVDPLNHADIILQDLENLL